MVSVIEAIVLGLIQGFAEWLPVSSSGHLVVAQKLLGVSVPVLFDVILHLGTMLVVLYVLRKEIYAMFRALFKLDFTSEGGKLIIYLLIATAITGVIGIVFKKYIEQLFSSVLAVGIGWVITAVWLFVCDRADKKEISAKDSALIGLAQGIAIVPGISRSGATIGMGLFRGIDREKAARFSLLIAIPAVLGASLLEINSASALADSSIAVFSGFVAAIVSGALSVWLLFRLLRSQKLKWCAYYCAVVGALAIALSIAGIL
jgi:undecaprenyl-diphosphatase